MQYPFPATIESSLASLDVIGPAAGQEREYRRPRAGHHGGHPRVPQAAHQVMRRAASRGHGSPGAAGPRWRRAARPGGPVSAATSSAARPGVAAASACGTSAGQQAPGHRRCCTGAGAMIATGRDWRQRLQPDRRAARPAAARRRSARRTGSGATLSGCPSSSLASAQRRGSPWRAHASRQAPGAGARAARIAGHDRRRRRAETATVRYPVQAAQREAGRLAAEVVERGPHGPDDQVLLPGVGHLGGALARPPSMDRPAARSSAPRPRRAARAPARARRTRARGWRWSPAPAPGRPALAAPPRHQVRSREAEGGGGHPGVGGDRRRGGRARQRPVRVLQAVAGDRADHARAGRDRPGGATP